MTIRKRGVRGAWVVAGALVLVAAVAVGWRLLGGEVEGERAPDVSVQFLDGRVVSLASLEGQVVLVNFWATWCPPCRLEMPGFQRVYEARRDDGFTIVGLSTDQLSEEQIRWFLEQRGIEYPVGRASRYVADAFGGARTLPTSFLIDARGRIRREVTGVYDERELVTDVDGLLREAGLEPTGEVAEARREAPTFVDLEGAGHVMGASDAPVTVVEFSDYGCAYCKRFTESTFPGLEREYIETGRVRWVHIPFVLGKFPNSEAATRAAVCAGEQGDAVFQGTHLTLYRRQAEWRSAGDPQPVFRGYVERAGGSAEAFDRCYGGALPSLAKAERVAMAAGVGATPTFFVDGRRVQGAVPGAEFRRLLETALD
jgi:protein-disulfide isomerase/peroxiredoxin